MTGIGFWPTVRLLMRAARRRGEARRRRQQELLRGRGGSNGLGGLAVLGAILFAALAHGAFSFTLNGVVTLATYHEGERDGRMLVGRGFERDGIRSPLRREAAIRREALARRWAFGGELAAHEAALRRQLDERGAEGFAVAATEEVTSGLAEITAARPLGLVAGLAVVAVWFLMMAFQGEGLELDVQRQRFPMWEWLFSHPIPPAGTFFAEMLAPLAANPIFVAAPIFWGLVLWYAHGPVGAVGGAVVGVAMGVAASCFSKAIEIATIVRLPPRSRGAVLGILSWIGYSALVVGIYAGTQRALPAALLWLIERVQWLLPVAPARWLFGVTAHGEPSLALAVATNLLLATAIVAGSVWAAARSTDAGVTGRVDGSRETRPARAEGARPGLVRDPLFRKELLWFARDRSAVVQAVLIPVTMGATQAFQFRSFAESVGSSWNWLCGLGVLCGTYMLSMLGPRSLASEGAALWIALTWPRGLEPLLKAKARLWWLIGSVAVLAVLAYALTRFPHEAPQILVVALGWVIFGRSLAEKMVTLAVAPSTAGEPEPAPRGRRWAAQLGTFSFGIGVITKDWHLATLGVTYSTLTATAMWQNFRERLPCLYDPESERLPPPPTLMHAMVAISAMVDGMAIVGLPIAFFAGFQHLMATRTVAYGLTAGLMWVVMSEFLRGRGVPPGSVWRWPTDEQSAGPPIARRLGVVGTRGAQLLFAAGIGMALGAFALLYQTFAERVVPWGHQPFGSVERFWVALAAVGLAPFAEEYLFRGLLLRALDREWGGWRAIAGATLFFALYHPPISWIPVGLVGVVLALLFKATGSLWPGVLVHAVYNAIVTLAP